jgi:glutathione S-transferase
VGKDIPYADYQARFPCMPALEIGPTAVVESGAIVQHIVERFD